MEDGMDGTRMWVFFVVVIVSVVATNANDSAEQLQTSCAVGWDHIPGIPDCMKAFDDGRQSWDGARQVCKDNGGDLAVIDHDQKEMFMKDLKKGVFYWIGGLDHDMDGQFHFLDGNNVTESFPWRRREPNNAHGYELCLEMKNGLGYDKQCCKLRHFVCQRPQE